MKKITALGLAFVMLACMLPVMSTAGFAEDQTETMEILPEADTYVFARAGKTELNYNYGGANKLIASRTGNRMMPVLRFDLSALPENAVVTGAVLELTQGGDAPANYSYTDESTGETVCAQYQFGRFLSAADPWDDWKEGAGTGAVTADSGLTGQMVNDRGVGDKTVPEPTVVYTYQGAAREEKLAVDVKELLDGESAGHKLSIWYRQPMDYLVSGKNIGNLEVFSKEAGEARAPKLKIAYTIPSGEEESVVRDAEALKLQEQTRTEGVMADLDLNHISRDISLPVTGANGSPISWETTDPAVITADGKITRPDGTEAYKEATLTATVGTEAFSIPKEFKIRVTNLKYPEADAFWTNKTGMSVDGNGTFFQARGTNNTGKAYRAGFLRFTLPKIAEDEVIASAALTITATSNSAAACYVSLMGDDWYEYGETADTVSELVYSFTHPPVEAVQIPFDAPAVKGAVTIDVTELLRGQSPERVSFFISGGANEVNTSWNTREAASGMPELAITTVRTGVMVTELTVSDGETVYGATDVIPASAALRAAAQVKNTTGAAREVRCIAVVCDGQHRVLQKAVSASVTVESGAAETLDCELGAMANHAGGKVRIFVWDAANAPICEAAERTIAAE